MALYERFIRRAGPRPTLVEWDTNIPSFATLAGEAAAAKAVLLGSTLPKERDHAA
jgi:uncharacterized protein (UPF0276 family)